MVEFAAIGDVSKLRDEMLPVAQVWTIHVPPCLVAGQHRLRLIRASYASACLYLVESRVPVLAEGDGEPYVPARADVGGESRVPARTEGDGGPRVSAR